MAVRIMAVRIEPGANRRLQLAGDIEAVLDVPERAINDGFSLAFSDGTLVHGHYPESASACSFFLSSEGAALVRITRKGIQDVLELNWDFDWITLACGTETVQPHAAADDQNVLQLTLDIVVEEAA
ncbi:hypothetical protein ABVV53_09475 [Novosphingobium sp. RD2P27]|uniref:Uncharacterized protein n=1 Tax=Novosphingobium kalidii TaxID=3230299 RepID=A0ABV2D1E5_9SPHN